MKGARGGLLAVALALPALAAVPPGNVPFGVYDPEGRFAEDPDVRIEHLFLPWEDVDLTSLVAADAYASDRDRLLLVTAEPWSWSRPDRVTEESLKTGISAGRYDGNILVLCAALAELKSPVTLRWAQEMDHDDGQFIWAGWPPATYIAAYRRVVQLCRSRAPGVTYMWSPLGDEQMTDYYPGDDVVDVIGLSVFGLQEWEVRSFGAPLSFADILGPRYDRAERFGKPIVVAELGFLGDADYSAAWNGAIRQSSERFPRLAAVIYFNQKEVYPWPDGFGLPDWRLPDDRRN